MTKSNFKQSVMTSFQWRHYNYVTVNVTKIMLQHFSILASTPHPTLPTTHQNFWLRSCGKPSTCFSICCSSKWLYSNNAKTWPQLRWKDRLLL